MLACALIPIWFKSTAIGDAPGQITSDEATAYFAIAVAIVTAVTALLGPVFGVISDHQGMKKKLFAGSLLIGVIGCLLNGFMQGWFLFLLVNVIARISYSASLMVYDSMLCDITQEERMDVVSSYGYAWGYLGSCIPFAIALVAYVLGPDMVGGLFPMLLQG